MPAKKRLAYRSAQPQFNRERFQRGTIRRVTRASGFVWEFRYYTTENGERKLKQQTFNGAKYPTETAVRKHVEHLLLKLNEGAQDFAVDVTFGAVIDRYIAEELPPKHSSKVSALSRIECHIRPAWGDAPVAKMKAAAIRSWLQSLQLAPLTKGHVRSIMHKLLDLAMLWEYIPAERNPVDLVMLRGVTKRKSAPTILSPEQVQALLGEIPEPFDLLTLVTASLGLRLSEALGLQWVDFSADMDAVSVQRNWYRGYEDTTKTESSEAQLPIAEELAVRLKAWHEKQPHETQWVFCNPATGAPYSGPSIQQRWLRTAAEKMGLGSVGFHDFRHSYRSWLDAEGTPLGVQKSLMRHSSIATTMNVYGGALTPEKRKYSAAVNRKLFGSQAATEE
ncbi:MAG TPA: site-specific integrase [Acidobacteriaceae bacterium]|jgi:integrase|nr:site-specific integrase [Acidobacteriaceae bacterium]